MEPEIGRVVALGASNLTRGFHTVVCTARAVWGPAVEVLGALGHGRSYEVPNRFLVRTLPGILESGLWQQLERLPALPTRGLITDVGNDILYGFSVAQTLAWVKETVDRLKRFTQDIVLTDLPVASIQRLSQAKFFLFRSILFPKCRLSLEEVVERVEEVNAGLASLAAARGLKFFRLRAEWYGFDPIHIRPSFWRHAWREILYCRPDAGEEDSGSWFEGMRLYLMAPERQWLFGLERILPQLGVPLQSGARVWLF
jgi:hypothetical protein